LCRSPLSLATLVAEIKSQLSIRRSSFNVALIKIM
jgi:hypothetical protein